MTLKNTKNPDEIRKQNLYFFMVEPSQNCFSRANFERFRVFLVFVKSQTKFFKMESQVATSLPASWIMDQVI